MTVALAAAGPSLYWYLTRSAGAVALVLLTLTLALGVVDVRRFSTPRWPRFLLDSLHRSVSLLAVVFLGLHILTAALDSFAPISLLDAIVPFAGSYRPFWLGLGAVAFDLMLAVTLTSVLRRHLSHGAWRTTHWLAYASWPLAVVHGLGTGSDVQAGWLLDLSLACTGVVLVAVTVRAVAGWTLHPGRSGMTLGVAAAFLVTLAVWLPSGPLGREWARRSGTPARLLTHGETGTASTTPRQP